MAESYFPCGADHPQTTITMFVFSGITSAVTVVVSIMTSIELRRQFKEQSEAVKSGKEAIVMPKSLYHSQMALFGLCLLEALTLLPTLVGNCYGSILPQWLYAATFYLYQCMLFVPCFHYIHYMYWAVLTRAPAVLLRALDCSAGHFVSPIADRVRCFLH